MRSRLFLGLSAFILGALSGWLASPSPGASDIRNSFAPPSAPRPAPSPPSESDSLRPSQSDNDFASRLHNALSISKRSKRSRAILAAAKGMSVTEIQAALAKLEVLPLRERDEIRNALLAEWSKLDPESAIRYVMALPNLSERKDAVSVVVGIWFGKDPSAAESWVLALPAGPLRNEAMATLVESLAVSNPRHALKLAQDSRNLEFER